MQSKTDTTPRRDRWMECHYLAQTIETIHAKELARRHRGWGRNGKDKNAWRDEYDPLAATELGNLLYNRLVRSA
jgi:hypothetical protein